MENILLIGKDPRLSYLKMLLDADDARFDEILQQAVRTAKKIEPDFEIEL